MILTIMMSAPLLLSLFLLLESHSNETKQLLNWALLESRLYIKTLKRINFVCNCKQQQQQQSKRESIIDKLTHQ